jgi:O-antigen/teichoic acid export membrane protein
MLRKISVSDFTKNVLVVFKGSAISQVILLLSTPILSRIFLPSSFGLLSVYVSISSILGSLFTLKYELPIVIPPKKQTAISLMIISIFSSFIFSLITFIVLLLFGNLIFSFFKLQHNIWLFILIPCTTFVIGLSAVLQQWNVRQKKYNILSTNNIIGSVSNTGVSIGLGLFGVLSVGLIFGYYFSFIFGISYMIYKIFLNLNSPIQFRQYISKQNLKNVFKDFNGYPKYVLPTTFFSVLSYQILPIILQNLFSLEFVGYYSMANRLSLIPSIVIGSAIGSVFRSEVASHANENKDLKPLFFSTLKRMVLLGIVIYSLLSILAPTLFSVFLGSNWKPAGIITRTLVLYIFSQFIVQTFYDVLLIKSKLKIYFILQMLLVSTVVISIFVGNYLFHDPYKSITLMSVTVSVTLIISLYTIYKTIDK